MLEAYAVELYMHPMDNRAPASVSFVPVLTDHIHRTIEKHSNTPIQQEFTDIVMFAIEVSWETNIM